MIRNGFTPCVISSHGLTTKRAVELPEILTCWAIVRDFGPLVYILVQTSSPKVCKRMAQNL